MRRQLRRAENPGPDTYTDSVYDLMRLYPESDRNWLVERGTVRRGNLETYNVFDRAASENPRSRIERIYGEQGKNPDFFDEGLVPSLYTHDLGLSRKNFVEFLPYLRRRIGTSGMGDLRHLDATDVFQNINYGENWDSAMRYRPMETHPNITGLVSDIKKYDVARGRNRREDLDEWARLFRDKGYGRIARDLQSHEEGPTMQPLVNQEHGEDLADGVVRIDGAGYKISQHTEDQAKRLGVEVKPSQLAKKKIDVFRGGKKVASVGHTDYCDFPTFRECCGKKMANARREAYKTRHEKSRHKEGSPSFYADKLLW